MAKEGSSPTRKFPPHESELRLMLEERTRFQDALWKQRAKVVGRLFLGLGVIVIGFILITPELRNAVIGIFSPQPLAPSKPTVVGTETPPAAMQALLQKVTEAQAPGGEAENSSDAGPAQNVGSNHRLDPGDVRFIRDFMSFMQPGSNEPSPKPAEK